jgi:hypothetical protein
MLSKILLLLKFSRDFDQLINHVLLILDGLLLGLDHLAGVVEILETQVG